MSYLKQGAYGYSCAHQLASQRGPSELLPINSVALPQALTGDRR